jgi:hypothetical protein
MSALFTMSRRCLIPVPDSIVKLQKEPYLLTVVDVRVMTSCSLVDGYRRCRRAGSVLDVDPDGSTNLASHMVS